MELILGAGDGTQRTIKMDLEKMDREKATFRAAPGEASTTSKAHACCASLFPMPAAACTGSWPIGISRSALTVMLSEVSSLRLVPQVTAVLANDKKITGVLADLGELAVVLGSETLKLNPAKAVELTVQPGPTDNGDAITVIVRLKNRNWLAFTIRLPFVTCRLSPVSPQQEPTSTRSKKPRSSKVFGFSIRRNQRPRSPFRFTRKKRSYRGWQGPMGQEERQNPPRLSRGGIPDRFRCQSADHRFFDHARHCPKTEVARHLQDRRRPVGPGHQLRRRKSPKSIYDQSDGRKRPIRSLLPAIQGIAEQRREPFINLPSGESYPART